MRMTLILLAVFTLGASASLATAQDGDRPSREDRRAKFLERFDTNKDGKIDDEERAKAREEFAKNRPEGERRRGEGRGPGQGRPSREEILKKFDTNGDGQLDEGERAKMREEFLKNRPEGARRGEGRGEGRPSREEILKKFDTNGDGQLDEAERAKMREEFLKNRPEGARRGEGRRRPGGEKQ